MNETTQEVPLFNPNAHLIQIKSGQTSKDYLPVQWRIVWFRSLFPQGVIETEMLQLDLDRETEEEAHVWNSERRRSEKVMKQARGFCVFHAVVKDGIGGIASGTKSEKAASFPDFIEKSETGAIGRALAALGFGTQFAGDEWEESHRIADAPVDRQNAGSNDPDPRPTAPARPASVPKPPVPSRPTPPVESVISTGATEQQRSSIRKLYEHLGRQAPDAQSDLSFADAAKLLQQLAAEYRELKQRV